jgi:hypothetical protein
MLTVSGRYSSMVVASWKLVVLMLFMFFIVPVAQATDSEQENNSARVLEAFDRQKVQRVDEGVALGDHKKHLIMFMLGVPLVIMLLITGALGIAMAVYGKPLFVAHMISAGLTVTLAIAHVIVGVVWFFPF